MSLTDNPANYLHFLGAIAGVAIGFVPAIVRRCFPASSATLETTDLAGMGAAFMAIYSAFWWSINAVALEPYSNAMAAIYAASAAFFTSASFRLKGVEGMTRPGADVARIKLTYHVAQWLPVLLVVAIFAEMAW